MRAQNQPRVELTPKQANIYVWGWQPEARFRYGVCGRRFGKTYLLREENRRAARLIMLSNVGVENEIWYGAPTFKQAKRVFWAALKRSLPKKWIDGKPNESECYLRLVTGHIIRIVGLDQPDNLRGSGLYFFMGDEWDDAKDEVWPEVIRPMLSTVGGHALFIGSPKGFGKLYNGYKDGQGGRNNVKSWRYTTIEGGNVPQEEIDEARASLDLRTFRQEYEASFESYAGQVYYAFSREKSVKPCPFNPDLPVHIGMDFNINPMSAGVYQEQANGEIWQVDEISIPTANTDDMANEIVARYAKPSFDPLKPKVDHITIYPDPAGAQRRTSAQGKTDIGILEARGFVVRALKSHPLVRDRINLVNAKFENAEGKKTLFIDPSCKISIQCLERQLYKDGTSEPDKEGGFDHMNDQLGYYMFARFSHKPVFRTNLGHMTR